MEGAEITLERLDYVTRASQGGLMREQVFCAFVGEAPREDFIPYTADFFLQLEDVKWTIIAGVVGTAHHQRPEPRLLAQRRRVREALVRRNRQRRRPPRDGQGGRADGERSGEVRRLGGTAITARIAEMAEQFLQNRRAKKTKKKEAGARSPAPRAGANFDPTRAPDRDRQSVVRILQADRQPTMPVRHSRVAQLLVGMSPLRRQHGQAAQAFHAAEAGGSLDDLQAIEEAAARS